MGACQRIIPLGDIFICDLLRCGTGAVALFKCRALLLSCGVPQGVVLVIPRGNLDENEVKGLFLMWTIDLVTDEE